MRGQPDAGGGSPGGATARQEWAQGWTVVFAAVLGYTASAIHQQSIGVFMKPLSAEFGWSRAQISAAASMASIGTIITAPLVGRLVDRFGARKVGSIGLPLYCLGIAAAGLTGPSILSWYLVWGFVAMVYMATGGPVWTAGVASRFSKQRGLALAICLTGQGLAASVWPTATAFLLQHWNWRVAYFVLGGVAFVVAFTALRLFFFDAKALRQREARTSAGASAQSAAPVLTGVSPRQALGSIIFWRLALMPAAAGLGQGLVVVHSQAIMRDHGFSMGTAAAYAALVGPFAILGRLLSGFFLDRVHGRYVAAVDMALLSATLLVLWSFSGQPVQAVAIAVLYGLATGGEFDTMAYMNSRYFGLKSFGVIIGFLLAANGLAFGVGPLLGGWVYDTLGTYTPLLIALAVIQALAALTMLTLPPYPREIR